MSNANDRERSDEGSGDWLEPLPSGDSQGASNEAASEGYFKCDCCGKRRPTKRELGGRYCAACINWNNSMMDENDDEDLD